MNDVVLKAEQVAKMYRLYSHPVDRLKESLHPLRRKYHRDFHALRGVSFEVRQGETVGIIGKNGSGKSTLLKILTGVLTPTSGQVTTAGRISALLELGAGFNPELTGVENVHFSGAIMGYSREEMDERLPGVIAFADIGEFIRQPVKTYSSGMFVRLAFAVAINVDPDILVIDEALAVGDMHFQAKCYRKFNEFRERGKTVVFVTHGLDSIIRYCNRALVLHQGVKVVETDPKEAVDVYKRLMVEAYGTEESESAKESAARAAVEYKKDLILNPHVLDYGDRRAEIVDLAILDPARRPVQKLINGEPFVIVMRVRFHAALAHPIFAYTIKDIKGLEITGTNTDYRHVPTGVRKTGDRVEVEFAQALNLQAGRYALSLGCTGFEGDRLVVYHRLYDVLLFEVVSESRMVGFFDLAGEVTVRDERAGTA
ncbi:MAG: ABC transporter ATP-binding protein [Lentisphaerae bacterium]|nr:ABC transporter ATP-binding protein [Lentisphaerota bacterium]